jgi:archaellum component FlaF (FlaF/FlaG flagellin family)
MRILGVTASGFFGGGDFELISTTILPSAQSSVVFSDLGDYSSTYKHLQIRYTTRTTRSAASVDNLGVRFNGVTSASYSHHRLLADGSTVASYNGANATYMLGDNTTATTAPAGVFSSGIIDILDPYSTTKNKTIRILCGQALSGGNIVELVSGAFYSTDSLTSVQIFGLTGNLETGTRMSLYGIKG